MSKLQWKGSTLLAPVPAALVSCGTLEKPNALTIAWTGITCSDPPMTYISVRPERYSGCVSTISFLPEEIPAAISCCSSTGAAASVPASSGRAKNNEYFILKQLLF